MSRVSSIAVYHLVTVYQVGFSAVLELSYMGRDYGKDITVSSLAFLPLHFYEISISLGITFWCWFLLESLVDEEDRWWVLRKMWLTNIYVLNLR